MPRVYVTQPFAAHIRITFRNKKLAESFFLQVLGRRTTTTRAAMNATSITNEFSVFSVKYETAPCKRCGGSGRYAFNLMHGTVCFGCSGSKTFVTKDGERAKSIVRAAIARNGKHAAQIAAMMLVGSGVVSIITKKA
jgi:hypothetical protein